MRAKLRKKETEESVATLWGAPTRLRHTACPNLQKIKRIIWNEDVNVSTGIQFAQTGNFWRVLVGMTVVTPREISQILSQS
jgi:hypothetical protein